MGALTSRVEIWNLETSIDVQQAWDLVEKRGSGRCCVPGFPLREEERWPPRDDFLVAFFHLICTAFMGLLFNFQTRYTGHSTGHPFNCWTVCAFLGLTDVLRRYKESSAAMEDGPKVSLPALHFIPLTTLQIECRPFSPFLH